MVAGQRFDSSTRALAATSPTTLAGVLAYLEFAAARNEQDFLIFDGEEEMAIFMESLAQPHVIM